MVVKTKRYQKAVIGGREHTSERMNSGIDHAGIACQKIPHIIIHCYGVAVVALLKLHQTVFKRTNVVKQILIDDRLKRFGNGSYGLDGFHFCGSIFF